MAKTFCEKHACLCAMFTMVLIAACGYLFYAGWWLPIAINTHRLRHNQLKPFEIYTLPLTDWYKYNMATQNISILTYRQMQEYNYSFVLGSFHESNFSVQEIQVDQPTVDISQNMSGSLFYMQWNNFTRFVDDRLQPNGYKDLFITMYSNRDCVDRANNTEIVHCFEDWFDENNATESPDYFVYTLISNQQFIDVNSQHASDTLDGPRDVFSFILMLFCFIWFFLVIDFFEDPDIGFEGINYMIITMFFIGCYYLWVFILSVVPIFFSLPATKPDLDYYRESLYSLTYTVGDYDAKWWVAGVLLSGIWGYALILFVPVIGCLYLLIACFCCCDEDRTDNCGACVIIPLLLVGVCVIIIFTFGFYVLFIGNLVFWNDATYKDMTDDNVIQAVTAILVFYVLLPIMGFLLALTTRYTRKYEKEKKRKMVHRVGSSLSVRLPIVKNRVSSNKPTQPEAGTETETVAMTQSAGDGTQKVTTA